MLRRRDFLEYVLASTAALSVSTPSRRLLAANPQRRQPPRYVIGIFLRGGIDKIWTTDPREPRDVSKSTDLPYKSDQIVATKGVRFGPHFKDLLPWASRIAVLRGVRMKTANHVTGDNQMLRFRTNWTYTAPSIADVIGSARDTQALSALYLGGQEVNDMSPTSSFGEARLTTSIFTSKPGSLLALADASDPEDLRLVARSLARQADATERTDTSLRGRKTVESWRSASRYLERVSKIPKFEAPRLNKGAKWVDDQLMRAAWAIEHDLARSITIKCLNWDTHAANTEQQSKMSGYFMPPFLALLKRLSETRNEHGPLIDQTMIYMGSELGRYPRLNTDKGKDHFPEADFMLVGSGFNAGSGAGITFGGSDRDLASLPVDPVTGAVAKQGIEVDLDDLGTSLVQLSGVDPRRFGYSGRYLDFLTPKEAA
jgi:uncharacterized protein (DUF1501 family)